jgi:hypothetical protein
MLYLDGKYIRDHGLMGARHPIHPKEKTVNKKGLINPNALRNQR